MVHGWLAGWVGLHLLVPPHNSQQLGMAGLDKAMCKGPALSVPPTCLISLLPWAGPGCRELAGRGDRVSWSWLSSSADSWDQHPGSAPG